MRVDNGRLVLRRHGQCQSAVLRRIDSKTSATGEISFAGSSFFCTSHFEGTCFPGLGYRSLTCTLSPTAAMIDRRVDKYCTMGLFRKLTFTGSINGCIFTEMSQANRTNFVCFLFTPWPPLWALGQSQTELQSSAPDASSRLHCQNILCWLKMSWKSCEWICMQMSGTLMMSGMNKLRQFDEIFWKSGVSARWSVQYWSHCAGGERRALGNHWDTMCIDPESTSHRLHADPCSNWIKFLILPSLKKDLWNDFHKTVFELSISYKQHCSQITLKVCAGVHLTRMDSSGRVNAQEIANLGFSMHKVPVLY